MKQAWEWFQEYGIFTITTAVMLVFLFHSCAEESRERASCMRVCFPHDLRYDWKINDQCACDLSTSLRDPK